MYSFADTYTQNTEKKPPNLFTIKTRRVSREMQHDRLQAASTLTYLLRSRSEVRCGDGGCTRDAIEPAQQPMGTPEKRQKRLTMKYRPTCLGVSRIEIVFGDVRAPIMY